MEKAEVVLKVRKRCFHQGKLLKVKNYIPSVPERKLLKLQQRTDLNGRPARTWCYVMTDKGGELRLRGLEKEEIEKMALMLTEA